MSPVGPAVDVESLSLSGRAVSVAPGVSAKPGPIALQDSGPNQPALVAPEFGESVYRPKDHFGFLQPDVQTAFLHTPPIGQHSKAEFFNSLSEVDPGQARRVHEALFKANQTLPDFKHSIIKPDEQMYVHQRKSSGMQATPDDKNACPDLPKPRIQATPGEHNAWENHQHESTSVPIAAKLPMLPLERHSEIGSSALPSDVNCLVQREASELPTQTMNNLAEDGKAQDPWISRDPWSQAIASANHKTSRSSSLPSDPSQQQMRPYQQHGGVNQFASRKRGSHAGDTNILKRSRATVTSESNQDHHQINDVPHPLSSASTCDSGNQQLLSVWVGHGAGSLYKMFVKQGTTVGQVAIAEGNLLELPEPVRTLDAMGLHLPVYREVFDNQIILFEDGTKPHLIQYPFMDNMSRHDALWSQQGWVACDEMKFYLQMIGQPNLTNTTPPVIVPQDEDGPRLIEEWLTIGMDKIGAGHTSFSLHTACLFNQHWFPISALFNNDEIKVTTTLTDLPTLKNWIQVSLGFDVLFQYRVPIESFPADCGFQTIAAIMAHDLADSRAYPMSSEDAIKWRQQFANHLANQGTADRFDYQVQYGGVAEPLVTELSVLLQAHGVKADRVGELATHLIQTFGKQSIQQTLGSARPWADMKAKASAHRPPIKLVLTEELQSQIHDRLQTGKQIGNKKNKQNKRASQTTWSAPRASEVQIPNGIFQQSDGSPLNQITLHQMQLNQKGVAVVNIEDALPFLHLQKPISAEGIGMLVLDFHDQALPACHQIIRFPASCAGTQEPMILTAALLQLGQQQVTRLLPSDPTGIEQVETAVVRAVIYKDQCTVNSTTMATKPVKNMLALEHFDCLGKEDILDVWDRQHLSKMYQKVKPEESDLFSVVLRVKASSLSKLLESNSKDGIYFEPRQQSGRAPCPEHRVIWLPKKSFHDVLIAKQSTHHETHIARNGDRFGLRTSSQHAADVHALHRPDVAYLDGTNTSTYRIAPLPFGSTKQSIQKVFDTWEWNARPSHSQGHS